MRHRHIYALLRRVHSPVEAAEILTDAQWGDKHARQWIGLLFFTRRHLSAVID